VRFGADCGTMAAELQREAGEKYDAGVIAEPFREEVKQYIQNVLGGVGPKLVGLLANSDPAARKYAEWTGRACARDGIRYEVIMFTANYAFIVAEC
jgi:methylenetetrahydrofolate dehydrogenase (NAD+)